MPPAQTNTPNDAHDGAEPDDDLGAHLDAFLTSLERGEPRPSQLDSSADTIELEGIVQELHLLGRFVANPTMAADAAAAIPATIGKYEIRRWLGRGGQSTTYLARDPDLERTVVIKQYHDAGTADQRDRLLNEARSLARINSPRVAHCFEAGDDGCHPFLVLEHIPGRSLSQLSARELTVPRIIELIVDVAHGLRDVHRFGLVHRDVKPANIVIGDDGRARVVDFGMAHAMSTLALSASGTPAYMAPEQVRGETDRIDARTDVFGLGAVFYELLTGAAPFARENREQSLRAAQQGWLGMPAALHPEIPTGLMNICLRCLAPEKVNRFESIDQFLDAIHKWKWIRRAAWAVPAAAATAFAATLLAGFLLAASRTDPNPTTQHDLAAPAAKSVTTASLDAASLPADVFTVFAIDGRLRQDFAIDVDILGVSQSVDGILQLKSGDRIAIRINSERDCYVTVLLCSSDPPVQLFPSNAHDQPEDALVFANQPTTIPRSTAGHFGSLRAIPSKAKEALCVVASARPISLGRADGEHFLVFQSANQLNELQSRMRALVRRTEASDQLISQVVIPFWVGDK